ncbi:MAG: cache domain-containing protein, partial [Desulfopila sp.]
MRKKTLQISLRARIFLSFLVALFPVLLCISITVELYLIPTIEKSVRQDLKNSTHLLSNAIKSNATVAIRNHLRAIADKNREIALQHFSLIESGILSTEEAKRRLRDIFLSQRVGTSGYLYCLNSQGTAVIHPRPLVENTDVSNFAFVRRQMEIKEGYVEYDWKNPEDQQPRAKALYMVYFEPFDWIISASSYRTEFNELLDPEDLRETVLSLRFGENGYAYLFQTDGELLIHPRLKNFNVFDQAALPSGFARRMVQEKSGILQYSWRNPDEAESRKKIAVFETLPEYDWLVVSSAYAAEVLKPVYIARLVAHGATLMYLLVASMASFYLSRRLTRPVDAMLEQLDKNSQSGEHGFLPVLAEDELGRLAREFNDFLSTLEKQSETIRHEQKRYQSLFEANLDAVLLLRGAVIINCNPATVDIFEAEPDDIIGKTIYDFSPPKQVDGVDSDVLGQRIIGQGSSSAHQTFEWIHITASGKKFDAEVRLKFFDTDTKGTLLLAYVRDITERKRAEEAVRQSELRYRQIIENANDAIFIAQKEYIVFANKKATVLSGYSGVELIGQHLGRLIHPGDLAVVVDNQVKRVYGDADLPAAYDFRLIAKDETEVTVQTSTIVVDWDGEPATLNFLRDISDQKKMEIALEQAQKMEAIGTLAGGIAHDFNNLLMGIQGRISLMMVQEEVSDEQRAQLRAIEEYVKSAAGLTQQILGFARGGKYTPIPIDINSFIAKSSSMFGRTRKEIEVQVELCDAPVVVEADRSQLEQVVLNMYVNAWHAMPDGGRLMIRTEEVRLDMDVCRFHQVPPGRYAHIAITDTGCGIEQSIRQRIFDPFFTTKHKNRGTGLGLASAYGIIHNHKGFITV